jgi:TP901 family phage tail tape measure protein
MANRLTATMVVDLQDKTGAKTTAIIGNMNKLKRAERDLELAKSGMRLSNRDRMMERLMIEQRNAQLQSEADKKAMLDKRRAAMGLWASRGALATAAVGAVAVKAYRDYAALDRQIGRIVINADKGREAIQPITDNLRKVADQNKMPFEDVVDGLEALIASGRTLEESLAFLPTVTATAQASGSAVVDIAHSADAVAASLGITAGEMGKAFDEMAEGGKLGKFELNEMSQFLPSITPAFSALGYKGTEGLAKMVAMLQVVRMQTGTSGEAATNFGNVISKIYSSETASKFKKNFGIDLPKVLDETRTKGGDVLETFIDLAKLVTKGDLTKLSKIFEDEQAQKGLRALIMGGKEYKDYFAQILKANGTVARDNAQIISDSQAKIQQLSNNWDKLMSKVGEGAATVLNPVLSTVNQEIDDSSARMKASKGLDREQRQWQRQDYNKKYKELYPDAWWFQINNARMEDAAKVGRGEQETIMDGLNTEEGRRQGGAQTAKYPSRGSYASGQYPDPLGASPVSNTAPIPMPRPGSDTTAIVGQTQAAHERQSRYPSRGSYEATPRDAMASWLADQAREKSLSSYLAGPPPLPIVQTTPATLSSDASPPDASFWQGFKRFMLGAAADPSFNAKDHFGVETKAASDSGPQTVTLSGTPSVTITNPPPRPNVNVQMSVTIHEAQNADAVARQLGQAVRNEMNGLQAATNDSGL